MPNWLRRIDLREVWEEEDPQAISKQIAVSLLNMTPLPDSYLNSKRVELAERFEEMAEDTCLTVREFDYEMADLYDWGDMRVGPEGQSFFEQKKCCWIATA